MYKVCKVIFWRDFLAWFSEEILFTNNDLNNKKWRAFVCRWILLTNVEGIHQKRNFCWVHNYFYRKFDNCKRVDTSGQKSRDISFCSARGIKIFMVLVSVVQKGNRCYKMPMRRLRIPFCRKVTQVSWLPAEKSWFAVIKKKRRVENSVLRRIIIFFP